MKCRFFLSLLLFAAVLVLNQSCLGSSESSDTPEAAITSFTMGYYKVRIQDVTVDGLDTVAYVQEGGVMYPMTIDQLSGRIYNTDSLAYGSIVNKVTTSVYGTGTVGYTYTDSADVTYAWTSYDSIDFTRGLEFVVVSTDGSFTRRYKLELNIHKVFPDSLKWSAPDTAGFPAMTGLSSVIKSDTLYCFGTGDSGSPIMAFRDVRSGSWSGAVDLSGLPSAWNGQVTFANGVFCTVASGTLYSSENGTSWSSVKSGINSIVKSGNDCGRLWALGSDSTVLCTADMLAWDTIQSIPQGFPDTLAYVFSYPLATNSNLSRYVLTGLCSQDTLNASVWTLITGDTEWTRTEIPAKEMLRLPALDNLQVVRYDGSLFALGRGLDTFRQSIDNATTWNTCDRFAYDYSSWNRYMQLPAELNGYDGDFACITDNYGGIWIMTQAGKVWRGAINRLERR